MSWFSGLVSSRIVTLAGRPYSLRAACPAPSEPSLLRGQTSEHCLLSKLLSGTTFVCLSSFSSTAALWPSPPPAFPRGAQPSTLPATLSFSLHCHSVCTAFSLWFFFKFFCLSDFCFNPSLCLLSLRSSLFTSANGLTRSAPYNSGLYSSLWEAFSYRISRWPGRIWLTKDKHNCFFLNHSSCWTDNFLPTCWDFVYPTMPPPWGSGNHILYLPCWSPWTPMHMPGRPISSVQFSSVQLLSHVQLFATPWAAACQASLSITNSSSLPNLMSIESVMPSNRLILCCPFLLPPSIFASIRVFSDESALCIRWPKYWSFSFNISPSNEYPGLF